MQAFRRLLQQQGDIGGATSSLQPNGRATDCRVTRSSGNAELDATTCRLIERRFRYHPSRDPDWRPVRAVLVGNHTWEPLPETDEDR